jgi:hypothetical protein
MLMPAILTAMILRSIDALKTFDIIYAMSGGGPRYSSETLNIMAFKYSFEYFRMGQIRRHFGRVVHGCPGFQHWDSQTPHVDGSIG